MRDLVKDKYQQPPPRNQQRRRRRKRNLSLYYLLIFILVTAVGIILSLTVLFKIEKINVEGKTQYDTNSIIQSSKIKIGDNLLRINKDKIRQNIVNDLIYIDNVTVKRSFPNTVDIIVEPSVPYANVAYDKGFLLISKTGKILSSSEQPQEGIVVFKGFKPKKLDRGSIIMSDDKEQDKLLTSLCEEVYKFGITQINSIDITDKYNITMLYDNRITIEIGSQNDLEYKIKYANELINKNISPKKEGTIFMRGDNGASFVEKKDLEDYLKNFNTATVTQSTKNSTTTAPKVTTIAGSGE